MNLIKSISIGTLVVGITAALFCTSETNATANKVEAVNQNTVTMPDFSVKDENGKAINLRKLKGKKVFVNLWATWCGPCRREMPSINSLYKKVNGKAEFIMLSLDDDFNKARSYKSNQAFALPFYYPAENLPSLFQVDAIPTTFVFNEKGELIKRLEGAIDYNSEEFLKLLTN